MRDREIIQKLLEIPRSTFGSPRIAEFISAMPSTGYCINIVLEILCSPFQTFRDEAAVTPGEEMVSVTTVPNTIATVVGPQEVLV